MSTESSISWTDATWNPVRGCVKISPGCKHCYAETFAERWRGVPGHAYELGFDPRLAPDKLGEPLGWRRPRRVFVNSMSDLFFGGHRTDVAVAAPFPFEYVAAVFGVMAATPRHEYQILTKRPERAEEFLAWLSDGIDGPNAHAQALAAHAQALAAKVVGSPRDLPGRCRPGRSCRAFPLDPITGSLLDRPWPLDNVLLGVSVEDRKYGVPRINVLRRIPWGRRFLSIEPLLEDLGDLDLTGISWVIVGGESGPGARPLDLAWVRRILAQCREQRVPAFCKQLGARPFERTEAFGAAAEGFGDALDLRADATRPPQMDGWTYVRTQTESAFYRYHRLHDRKGEDPGEWPEDLRVREWPASLGE